MKYFDKIKSKNMSKVGSDMIPQDKLEKIIENNYTATGMGKQSPIIIAVTTKNFIAFCNESDGR